MSKFFDDEKQPIVTKFRIKCPNCGTENDVLLGLSIVDKSTIDNQPKQRTLICKSCNNDITVSIADTK